MKLHQTASTRAGTETSSPRFPKGKRHVDDSRRAQYRSLDPGHLGNLQSLEMKNGLGSHLPSLQALTACISLVFRTCATQNLQPTALGQKRSFLSEIRVSGDFNGLRRAKSPGNTRNVLTAFGQGTCAGHWARAWASAGAARLGPIRRRRHPPSAGPRPSPRARGSR